MINGDLPSGFITHGRLENHPFLMWGFIGTSLIDGPFSIAVFDYWRVNHGKNHRNIAYQLKAKQNHGISYHCFQLVQDFTGPSTVVMAFSMGLYRPQECGWIRRKHAIVCWSMIYGVRSLLVYIPSKFPWKLQYLNNSPYSRIAETHQNNSQSRFPKWWIWANGIQKSNHSHDSHQLG